MKASQHEQHYARLNDVKLRFCASPKKVLSENGHVTGIEFDAVDVAENGSITKTGKSYQLDADVIFKAIGQTLVANHLESAEGDLVVKNGKLDVNDDRKTALDNVWAGGDCVTGGEDLTVSAVQDGKVAALAINAYFKTI